MKIKEDLVYDKFSGHIIGFTSLGDLNDTVSRIQQQCEEEVLHPPISKYIFGFNGKGHIFQIRLMPISGTDGAMLTFSFR